MKGFLEVSKKALESYRKDLISSILFGLTFTVVDLLKYIPILGVFFGVYLIPKILGWYYSKTIGNINLNYKLALKTWLVYLFILHIFLIIILFMILPMTISKVIFVLTSSINAGNLITDKFGVFIELYIALVIFFIIWLIFYYLLYASLLGKVNELTITSGTIRGSVILFLYTLIWSIIFSLIKLFALFISTVNIEIFLFTFVIVILFSIFVERPILELIKAHRTLSM